MTEPPALQIAELERRALEHFRQGRLREALADYDGLRRLKPGDAGTWHMLGVVYATLGDAENAAGCAWEAVRLAPAVAAGYRNLGNYLLQLGRAAEAEAQFREALSLSGGEAADHSNLGVALAALGRHADAVASYRRALALTPADPNVHFNLGTACQALGQWEAAVRHYADASRLAPAEARYLGALAAALQANGRGEHAIAAWMQVLQLVPGDLQALRNIGAIYYQYSRFPEAIASYRRAVQAAPMDTATLLDLGYTLMEVDSLDEAMDCFSAVLRMDVRNAMALYYRAYVQERMGLLDQALAGYAEVPPEGHDLDLVGARAGVLEKQGDFAAARALLAPEIASGRAGLRAFDAAAKLCRHFGDCNEVLEHMEARLRSGKVGESERRHLHFRAGELYDRQRRYDQAFAHFEAGNRLKHYRYSAAEDARYIDRLIEVQSPELYARLPTVAPAPDITPIFIVGMPRSGTTLVEQIVASHPDVVAGDELIFLSRIASRARGHAGESYGYPDYLPYLTQRDCEEMAREYLDELRGIAPGAAFVTDKMPHNFQYLGLLSRLFPNAPIIHCRRDAADVCLSCYFQDFASYHNYAYDLTHLGQHYRQYERAMDHYRNILEIPMLENWYESLVDATEEMSRVLVEFCGLTWDERCLRFYETGQKTKTASYDQVRQPIYKRSTQRWKHYEKFLQPLFDALAAAP